MRESASLLPLLLVLIDVSLHLLHVRVEVLPQLHPSEVLSLLLLLALPLHLLMLFLLPSLYELARFELSLAVTVECFMLFVRDVGLGMIQTGPQLLTLILKVSFLLFQASNLL